MKIWEMDNNNPNGVYNTANPESQNPYESIDRNRYRPQIFPTNFPIMQPTFDSGPQPSHIIPERHAFSPLSLLPPTWGQQPSIQQPQFQSPFQQPSYPNQFQQPFQGQPAFPQQFQNQTPFPIPYLGVNTPNKQQFGMQPTNFAPPSKKNVFTKETLRLVKANRGISIAITICVILLLGSLAALFTLMFAFEAIKQEPRTTSIQFTVTRKDLSYGPELDDPKAYAFAKMDVIFCDMITNSFLKGVTAVQKCGSKTFKAPGVTADMIITVLNMESREEDIFLIVASALVAASDADLNTLVISANSIKKAL